MCNSWNFMKSETKRAFRSEDDSCCCLIPNLFGEFNQASSVSKFKKHCILVRYWRGFFFVWKKYRVWVGIWNSLAKSQTENGLWTFNISCEYFWRWIFTDVLSFSLKSAISNLNTLNNLKINVNLVKWCNLRSSAETLPKLTE